MYILLILINNSENNLNGYLAITLLQYLFTTNTNLHIFKIYEKAGESIRDE